MMRIFLASRFVHETEAKKVTTEIFRPPKCIHNNKLIVSHVQFKFR